MSTKSLPEDAELASGQMELKAVEAEKRIEDEWGRYRKKEENVLKQYGTKGI